MKALLGVFFLYWTTGLSSKPILACDQHPGQMHSEWMAWVNKINAADAAKAAATEAAKESPKPEVARKSRGEAPRPRATAPETVRVR